MSGLRKLSCLGVSGTSDRTVTAPGRRSAGRWARALARAALTVTVTTTLAFAPGCKTGPNLSADYGQTARENFELALGEFADRDWEETIAYADFVRIRFPFSRYAVEAELLVARAEFHKDDYIIAQDSFRQFAKLHPTHRHVQNGWVAYMAALAAFNNAPSGFFLLPPYYQKDQSQLRDALSELRYFFDHHSGSVMEPYAVKLRDEVNRRLLRHELYVARYYLKKERPEAAIMRLETAHDKYAGIGLDAEVLFLLGLTYLRLDEIELARATFSELQTKHPTTAQGKQAPLYLKYIYDEFGPANPDRARPDRSPPKPLTPPLPKDKYNRHKVEKEKREAKQEELDKKGEALEKARKARDAKRAAREGQEPEPPADEPPADKSDVKTEPPDATSEPPTSDLPKSKPPKSEPPKSEPPKSEPPKSEPPESEPPKSEP